MTESCFYFIPFDGKQQNSIRRWVFEFIGLVGRKSCIEELALQRWENEQIAQETVFYDPVQFKCT